MNRTTYVSPDSGESPPLEISLSSWALQSPVIFTGRGGSGTRLISEIAQRAEVFLGNELNISGDSTEWTDLIYSAVVEKLQLNAEGRQVSINKWRSKFHQQAREVLAKGNWDHEAIWGWKLPETMVILPELFKIFNSAKLVHLVRHPVNSSLRRTHMTSRTDNLVGRAVLKAAYKHVGLEPAEIAHDEAYIHNARSWVFQIDTAMGFARSHLTDLQYLEVRYEDLCLEPKKIQNTILEFLDIGLRLDDIPSIDYERTHYFELNDPRVVEVWELCKNAAEKLGYERVR